MANGGEYYYGIGLNTAGLARGVDQAKRMFQGLGNTATEAGKEADDAIDKLKGSLMSLAAGVSLTQLAKKIVDVRGEVQQLEIAFETMLGSKAKADALMSEMMTLAAATPFGLQDVTGAAKQLLAFGSTSEEVAKEITMLGDIAAGMSIPLNDMIYLYGTTRTQGQLFTQDLRQFMGRGIPLAEELAKQFGVTKDKVGELVTAGKVGFPEVQKALEAMTSEGGKFGGLMEKQSQSVAGQVSALEDAIYQMFNEIGRSSEGVISDVLAGASWVVEHYEAVLSILSKVVIAWGTYKAALIVTAAYHKVLALGKLAGGLIQVAKGARTAAAAWRAFNMAVKSNPIGLALSAVATLGAIIWDMCSATEEATGETEQFAREIGELEKAARDEFIEVRRLAYEYEHLATTEEERAEVLKKLNDINPDIVDGVDALSGAYEQLTKNVAAYCEQQLQNIQLTALTDKQNDALERQGKAIADKASGEAELQRQLVNLQSEILSGVFNANNIKLVRVKGDSYSISEEMRNNVFGQIKELLGIDEDWNIRDDFEITPENARDIAYRIAHARVSVGADVTPSYHGGVSQRKGYYEYRDIDSFDGEYNFEGLLQSISDAEHEAEAAKEDLELILQDMPAILKSLGFEENPYNKKEGDGADAAMKYVDALRAAREAYLREQREFAAVKKNPEATQAEYFTAEKELKTAKEAYEKLGGVTKQATTDAEKQRKEAAKRMQQLEYDSQQAIIDIMAEGTDKKLAQLDLDYKKRMDAIAEQEAELLAKQGMLTEEQAAMFKNIRTGAANDYANAANETLFGDTDEAAKAAFDKLKADNKAWNEYLIKYGTFKEQMLATTRKYNQLIANAETEGEKKMLEAERDAIIAEYEERTSEWAKGLVDKSTAQLNKMVTELQAEVDAKQAALDALDSSDSTTAQQYREEINKLNAQIKVLEAQLKKAQKATKNKDWGATSEVFQGIATACDEAASALEGVEGGLASTFQNMAKVADVAASLVAAIYTVATASGALNAALGVIGLIAAAIQAVGTFISMLGDEYTLEDTINEAKLLNQELERMRKLAQIDSVEGTIFGENAFGNFQNNLRVMREALEEFGASQEDIINRGEEYWKTINEEVAGKFRVRAVKDRSWKDVEESIRNMQVKTRDRSGAAEFFGAEDEYGNLGDLAPELFVDGKVTLEGLQALKDSELWKKLTKENRDLIDELIADWERYNEATEAVTDYLKDVFGELGNEINDAIVDAFANGTDAAVAFGDVAGKMLENLIKQIGYTAYIAPILSQAMADVDDLNKLNLTPEEYLNALMGIVGDAMKEAEAGLDAYNDYLDRADRMAEEQGLNTFNGERSAEAKGITQASQDSVDEMNGRLTTIQSHTFSLVEGQKRLIADSTQVLKHLAGIEVNTAELKQMRQDISLMRSDISDMATRGIITR